MGGGERLGLPGCWQYRWARGGHLGLGGVGRHLREAPAGCDCAFGGSAPAWAGVPRGGL